MSTRRKLWKRIGSTLLTLAMLLSLLPMSALAAPPAGVLFYSNHYVIMDGEISKDKLNNTALEKLTPTSDYEMGTTDDTTINLWVSSEDMSGDDYQIPYVKDGFGNTWYLQQIVLYNFINDRDEVQILMAAEDISAATSKEDYIFSVENIIIKPYVIGDPSVHGNSWYDVCYGWTMTPPDQWGGGSSTQETYTVTYDFNIPEDVNSIFPITEYGIRGNESSGSYDYIKNKVDALTSTKLEDQNFVVADGLKKEGNSVWHGFFGYKWNDPDTSYYYFDGWTAEDGSEYETEATATASSTLAGNDNEIKFTGVWKEVPKWSEAELAEAEKSLTLDVFTRGDNGDLLIAQSTDTVTQKDNLISYTVSAAVNDDLLHKSDVPFLGGKFATFEIVINVDPNLEFVNRNPDGTVTLQMESKLVVPKTITATNGDFTWTGDGENWTVTFDPDQLPSGNNGPQICIQAEFTDKDYTMVSDVMTLIGLDFKLKEDAFDPTVGALQVNTSANMTAKMNLRNMAGPSFANTRFRLWVVEGLLGKNNANGEAWREYFGGGVDNPTAYVHALQFLDYKLADYDLSADTTATLKANTVTAEIVESEPIRVKPADITIYMGGDGGYDAVVDKNGTTIATGSASLPHPIFEIKVPQDVDLSSLTFTNTDSASSWKLVQLNGTDYYRFDPIGSSSEVRVQYSDGNTVVTEDEFTPETDVFKQYTVSIYTGGTGEQVIATTPDAIKYLVRTGTGTLTVRAVEDEDPTSNVQTAVPADKIAPEKAAAVAPTGTMYTLNNTGVALPADAQPALLFDHIIEDEGSTARTDALKDKVDEKLGAVGSNTTRHYEIKYLDLVDANNGNAWITSSAGMDIYWGYPKDTDRNTTFKLVHFKGLHRDDVNGNSGFDLTDISGLDLENVEIIQVTNTGTGIQFHVGPSGFSPFALVWESTTAVNPGDPTSPGSQDDDYTLHYVTNGGKHLSAETKSSAWTKDYEDLPVPERDGYTFVGWYWDLRLTDPVRGDVKVDKTTVDLYAKWDADGAWTGSGDVSDWLDTVNHKAFLSGYPDGTFGPDQNMTRAEVAQMFYSLLLDKDVKITKTFTDVPADAWYAKAVNTLASLGMLGGYPDGTFQPDRTITRAEFAVVALAFTDGGSGASCSFTDVNRSDWFYQYAAQASEYGWIGGYPDGSFRPNNKITRAEVSVIVNNMLGRDADERFIDRNDDQLVSFSDLTDGHWAYYTIMEATNTHTYTRDNSTEVWKAAT